MNVTKNTQLRSLLAYKTAVSLRLTTSGCKLEPKVIFLEYRRIFSPKLDQSSFAVTCSIVKQVEEP